MTAEVERTTHSPYMRHAKTTGRRIPFPLTSSGVEAVNVREFPLLLDGLVADLQSDPTLSLPAHDAYQPLQEALATKSGAEPECIVACAGTSMANHLVMAATLTRPGDQVLIEHPTYPLLVDTARYLLADVRSFDREPDTFSVDPERVRAVIEGCIGGSEPLRRLRLIVLTNLHNPSGALLDEVTLLGIGDIAEEHGARVLVDEVYLDALFENTPRSAHFLGPTFVATNSLTKIYGLGGLRCGWILAEPALAQRIWQLTDLFDVHPPHIAERLGVVALRELAKRADSSIRARAHELLSRNRALLNAFLWSRDDLTAERLPAGTVSFPRLKRGTATELIRLAEGKGTSVTDGAFFGEPEHVRIGIGARSDVVEEGLHRLGAALDELATVRPGHLR